MMSYCQWRIIWWPCLQSIASLPLMALCPLGPVTDSSLGPVTDSAYCILTFRAATVCRMLTSPQCIGPSCFIAGVASALHIVSAWVRLAFPLPDVEKSFLILSLIAFLRLACIAVSVRSHTCFRCHCKPLLPQLPQVDSVHRQARDF